MNCAVGRNGRDTIAPIPIDSAARGAVGRCRGCDTELWSNGYCSRCAEEIAALESTSAVDRERRRRSEEMRNQVGDARGSLLVMVAIWLWLIFTPKLRDRLLLCFVILLWWVIVWTAVWQLFSGGQ